MIKIHSPLSMSMMVSPPFMINKMVSSSTALEFKKTTQFTEVSLKHTVMAQFIEDMDLVSCNQQKKVNLKLRSMKKTKNR